jgi:DNA-binding NarL/FixJ family response regulator
MAGGRALFGLTSREWDVLQLLLLGKSNQEISTNLYISYKTTKTHVSHILQKLGARDRADVVVIAGRQGLLGARTVE